MIRTVFLVVLAAFSIAASGSAQDEERSISGIRVLFKLDSRLTRSLHLGDRWVSPATFSGAQAGTTFFVEARAQGRSRRGIASAVSAQWQPTDPEMVTVSPEVGSAVTITVRRPGESSLLVTSEGISRQLAIKAVSQNGIMQVEIAKHP